MRRYLRSAAMTAVLVIVAVNLLAAAIGCAGLIYMGIREDPQLAAERRLPDAIHQVGHFDAD